METLGKVMNSKIILAIVALLCSMGYTCAELHLGSDKLNIIVFSIVFGAIAGGIIELVRSKLLFESKYCFWNPIAWIIGAVIGSVIMFIE